MFVEITPLDNLFFKNGKSFRDGDGDVFESIFPPNPSTFYGALRSAWFAENPQELNNANTEKDPTKDLIIKGIYYRIDYQDYVPMPLDLVEVTKEEKRESNIIKKLELKAKKNANSKDKFTHMCINESGEKIKSTEGYLISIESLDKYLNKYLNKEHSNLEVKKLSNYYEIENKIGIARDKTTKNTRESMLYNFGMIRLKEKENLTIILETENLEFIENSGILKLGGEAKTCNYKKIENTPKMSLSDSLNSDLKTGDIIKLVFLTPVVFDAGHIPNFVNKETLEGKINDIKLKLISMCSGKPILIGGYDIKENKPKPMKKAVPMGSVYFFEILENNENKKLNEIFGEFEKELGNVMFKIGLDEVKK